MTLIIPVCSKLAVLSSGNPKIHIQYFLFAGSHDPHANVVKNTALIQMQTVFLIKKRYDVRIKLRQLFYEGCLDFLEKRFHHGSSVYRIHQQRAQQRHSVTDIQRILSVFMLYHPQIHPEQGITVDVDICSLYLFGCSGLICREAPSGDTQKLLQRHIFLN